MDLLRDYKHQTRIGPVGEQAREADSPDRQRFIQDVLKLGQDSAALPKTLNADLV